MSWFIYTTYKFTTVSNMSRSIFSFGHFLNRSSFMAWFIYTTYKFTTFSNLSRSIFSFGHLISV